MIPGNGYVFGICLVCTRGITSTRVVFTGLLQVPGILGNIIVSYRQQQAFNRYYGRYDTIFTVTFLDKTACSGRKANHCHTGKQEFGQQAYMHITYISAKNSYKYVCYLWLPFRLAAPPRFHVTHSSKGNLLIYIYMYICFGLFEVFRVWFKNRTYSFNII